MEVGDTAQGVIVTYALGSCVGVTAFDSRRKVGGILHALLPDSRANTRVDPPPAMFVDTGLQELHAAMSELGSRPEHREYKVFGGARVVNATDFLSIGDRNVAMMKRLALMQRLHIKIWDVGGQSNRTIQLYLDNGDVAVRMPGRPDTCV